MERGWYSAPWRAAFLVMLGGWIAVTLVDFLFDVPEVAVRVGFLIMIVVGFVVGENHHRLVRVPPRNVAEGAGAPVRRQDR